MNKKSRSKSLWPLAGLPLLLAAVVLLQGGGLDKPVSLLAAAALALFALGGPLDRGLPQDILLALERQDSTVEDLTQWAQSSIRNHSGVAQVQVEELWLDNVESRSADLYVRTPDGWWSGCLHCQRRGALLFGWSALDSPPLTRDMYRVR